MRNIFSKEFIESLPKTINSNGCWIPTDVKSESDGYVRLVVGLGKRGYFTRFKLHRVVICVYNNLDYNDKSWVTRHNEGCNRACFFIEHLKAGTDSDNCKDMVEHGTHRNIKKEACPKCGGDFRKKLRMRGQELAWIRWCPSCKYKRKLELKRMRASG